MTKYAFAACSMGDEINLEVVDSSEDILTASRTWLKSQGIIAEDCEDADWLEAGDLGDLQVYLSDTYAIDFNVVEIKP